MKEINMLNTTQENREEEVLNEIEKEINELIEELTLEGLKEEEIALVLIGVSGGIEMCYEKFDCGFSKNFIDKFNELFIKNQ